LRDLDPCNKVFVGLGHQIVVAGLV
jgi:hypothetical protein